MLEKRVLKRCKECKQELNYSFFHIKGKSKSGSIRRDTICKNCKSTVRSRLIELYGDTGLKPCSECHKNLPWEEFSFRISNNLRYLRSKCKSCSTNAWSEWVKLHPEYKDKKLESDRRGHSEFKKYHRRGITKNQYLCMLEAQENLCAICRQPSKDGQELAIDHNHLTEQVRGLLCKPCNRALGLFGDNINTIENALNYLKERGSYG